MKEAELYLFHVILRYINSGGATVYGKITAYQPRRRGKDPRPLCSPAPSPPLPHPRQPSASSFPEDTSIWLYPISPALPMERLMRVCSSPYLTKQQQAGPQSWGRALRTVGSRAGVRYGCCTIRYGLSSTGQDHPSAPGRTTEFPQNPTGSKLWQLDMVLFRRCPHAAVLPLPRASPKTGCWLHARRGVWKWCGVAHVM